MLLKLILLTPGPCGCVEHVPLVVAALAAGD